MKLKALKIANLLLFASIISFGQTSVPNTDTFSLQNVYDVVHGHASGTQQNLQSCFDNSVDSYFDATYKGSKTSLYNFRNYTVSSCSLPTVTTSSITDINPLDAVSGGNVTSDGGCSVTLRGVCWNTTGTPTISDSKTTNGSGTGSFSSNITGLTCGTTYYVRAYATNSLGTSYGSVLSFTTTSVNLPSFAFFYAINTSCGNYTVTNLTTAQQLCADLNNPGCTFISASSQSFRIKSVTVGEQVWQFTNCLKQSSANYYVYCSGGTCYIIHLDSNGIIDSKTQCYP